MARSVHARSAPIFSEHHHDINPHTASQLPKKLLGRRLLAQAAAFGTLLCTLPLAHAQAPAWPSKPVCVVGCFCPRRTRRYRGPDHCAGAARQIRTNRGGGQPRGCRWQHCGTLGGQRGARWLHASGDHQRIGREPNFLQRTRLRRPQKFFARGADQHQPQHHRGPPQLDCK